MAEAANEAQRALRKGFKDHLPGVFEITGSKRRGDPFANQQPTQEQGFDMAADELGRATESETNPRDFRHDDHEFLPLEFPTDPTQLKALPTGFHDMTDLEQQEELWIVQAEERLGREWELVDPGKHARYSHDYPPYSPSKVIGMLHRWRNRAWTPQQWRLARAIAGNRSLRLPVLTAQAFLRRHALLARRRGVELKIERYLGGTEEWKTRLAELESQTGASEADVKQWLWILSPESGDVKIQRFLRSKCRKPLFLLQLLLAKDKKIHEPATFLGLLQFMRENYVLADRPQDELNHPAYKDQGRSVTWWHYLVFLYRLVWHCREGWPAAMPLLARLTADYIGTMRLDSKARALTGYQARSLVLNKSLQYFSWPARVRPIDHMEHNWAAQRHLLRLAATTEPPLVMDQNGYRAVRTVLIALGKTKGEAKNADRAAKTWPPYRRTLDGIDERRDPEDDLSRSAKAGMLVRAAGYSDDIVDRALSALGGSTFGQAPTIQTRSLPPAFYSGRLASQNIYSEWAVQVRATRNAREAWLVFENPPEPGIRPTAQIYGEMFEKLYARPATESPAIRAGDAKEVFPVHDGNLSEFEIARLTPPSPEELYDHMLLQDKLRPTGYCLAVLIRNSSSKMMALRYLGDSPYKPYIAALKVPVSKADPASLKALSQLPLNIFNAWIAMLCRLHTRAPREQSVSSHSFEDAKNAGTTAADANGHAKHHLESREISQMPHDGSIPEAIALATAFQAHNAKAAHHDRLPWHTIMQALAGRKMLYSRMGAEHNAVETLVTFLRLYERTAAAKGIDPVAFEALCLVIRKTLKLTTFEKAEGGRMVPRPYVSGVAAIEELVFRAHRYAVRTFAALTSPVPANELRQGDAPQGAEPRAGEVEEVDDGVTPGMLRYNVVGRSVHKYMLALACCGDGAGMVRLMDWLLDGWDREYVREEAKTAHSLDYHYTMRTIAYFAEMGGAGDLVDSGEMDRLRQRLDDMRWEKGCTWFWPEEGWQGEAPVQALPELETDLVVVERWPRLRQMVCSADASPEQEQQRNEEQEEARDFG
jgi:DNA (cytosine-5)-methyltransferase 1